MRRQVYGKIKDNYKLFFLFFFFEFCSDFGIKFLLLFVTKLIDHEIVNMNKKISEKGDTFKDSEKSVSDIDILINNSLISGHFNCSVWKVIF